MSLDYIRRTYDVPAKRGARVRYRPGHVAETWEGRITGASGARIRVLFDGKPRSHIIHPTDGALEYLAWPIGGATVVRTKGPAK